MYPNETSQTALPYTTLYPSRSPPTCVWTICRSPFLLLTLVEVIITVSPVLALLMAHKKVQQWLLYRHKHIKIPFLSSRAAIDYDSPESQGFLRNQVTSCPIPTTDGQTLHSWLIMPVGAYTKHETVMTKSWSADEAREIIIQILRSDPKAVIAVYMHGNGNDLATEWRCQAYRNLCSGSPDHIYVLAFDYRGFGKSSGEPTEEGLIEDATSVLSWVEKKLTIPRARVLIVGHSLGSSVAIATVQRIAQKNKFAEYAGLILCSGFTDTPSLARNLKLFGLIPIVKPLTKFQAKGSLSLPNLITDHWSTEPRVRDLAKTADIIRISFMAAQDDDRVPSTMSETLYSACVDEIRHRATATERHIDLGSTGEAHEVRVGATSMRKVILKSGGHAKYMSWHPVSFEAMRMLTMTGALD